MFLHWNNFVLILERFCSCTRINLFLHSKIIHSLINKPKCGVVKHEMKRCEKENFKDKNKSKSLHALSNVNYNSKIWTMKSNGKFINLNANIKLLHSNKISPYKDVIYIYFFKNIQNSVKVCPCVCKWIRLHTKIFVLQYWI